MEREWNDKSADAKSKVALVENQKKKIKRKILENEILGVRCVLGCGRAYPLPPQVCRFQESAIFVNSC